MVRDLERSLFSRMRTAKYKCMRTAVYAEDLVVNDHGEGEEVEHIREVGPHV